MMLHLLKEFVEIYHRNKGLGEIVFTSDCLHVEKARFVWSIERVLPTFEL